MYKSYTVRYKYLTCESVSCNRQTQQILSLRTMEWSQPSQGQHDPRAWFTESQLRTVIRNGIIPEWFHGIISRKYVCPLMSLFSIYYNVGIF